MGDVFPQIDDRIAAFIRRQHLFFVATAPLGIDGRVNLSPKGIDSFAILDPLTVAYADLVGSGIETVAHLRENGRIVIMFCAFEGPPKILRLHGHGDWVESGEDGFDDLLGRLPPGLDGARAIIRIHVERIADSLRLRRPTLRLRGRTRPTLPLGGQEGRRRPSGLRRREQPGEHRRPPRAPLRPGAVTPRS